MRKTIVLLATAVFVLSACSKDDNDNSSNQTFCYECAIQQVTTATDMPAQTINTTAEQCGITEEQAKQIEQSGTSTITSSVSGISMTIKSTTTCRKK